MKCSIRRSGRSAWSVFCRHARPSERTPMSDQQTLDPHICVNGASEPLTVATLEALLLEREVDTSQRGIAVALNGAVVPRTAWRDTALKPGDSVEIVRAR